MNVNVSDLTPDQVRNVVSQLVRTNPDAVAYSTGGGDSGEQIFSITDY